MKPMLRLAGTTVCGGIVCSVVAQVHIEGRDPSEFFPGLTLTKNSRKVAAIANSKGIHIIINQRLDADSIDGRGHGIQGFVQYFRVGPQPVRAGRIAMIWRGTHSAWFEMTAESNTTQISVDVRLVRYCDTNGNGKWDGGELQFDLISVPVVSHSLASSSTSALEADRFMIGWVELEPNATYFFGGVVSFAGQYAKPLPYRYTQQGVQSFDLSFSPVATHRG